MRTPYPVRLRMLDKRIHSRTQIRETVRNGPVTDRKPSEHRNGSNLRNSNFFQKLYVILAPTFFSPTVVIQ
ncbi:unnamed protein product [Caenorhabditis nigoni]